MRTIRITLSARGSSLTDAVDRVIAKLDSVVQGEVDSVISVGPTTVNFGDYDERILHWDAQVKATVPESSIRR